MNDLNIVNIVVPLEPPSVNHYKVKTKMGVTFVTKEAKAFKSALRYIAAGRTVANPKATYLVKMCVYQGNKSRGDVDNYAKVAIDSLVDAGVIHSDAAITDLYLSKRRDREHPRTDITIRAILPTKGKSL